MLLTKLRKGAIKKSTYRIVYGLEDAHLLIYVRIYSIFVHLIIVYCTGRVLNILLGGPVLEMWF